MAQNLDNPAGMSTRWIKAGLKSITPKVEALSGYVKSILGLPVDKPADGVVPYFPMAPFDGFDDSQTELSEWAGGSYDYEKAFKVVFRTDLNRFCLRLTADNNPPSYYGQWPEVTDSRGVVLVNPSSRYSDTDMRPRSGCFFLLFDSAEENAAFYAFDGETLRPVNNFAAVVKALEQGLDDASEELGLHAARLERHHERLSDLDDSVEELRGNLQTAASMALSALNQAEDNAAAIEQAKTALFIDAWDEAWKVGNNVYGKFDPENAPDAEHPFLGNGIWMTYKEALGTLAYRIRNEAAMAMSCKNVSGLRTALAVFKPIYGEVWSISEAFRACADIEVVHLGKNFAQGISISKMDFAFYECGKLREIQPFIKEQGGGTHGVAYGSFYHMAFKGCAALEEVRIFGLKSDISLRDSPILSYDSVSYMVANASNTFAITITVHPDVYAKLTGDTDNEAAGALTAEELAAWQGVLTAAAEKNISFATT